MVTALVWFRVDVVRRWRSLAGIALLLALSTAIVLTAVAGARRGDSALSRLAARTLPATAVVMPFQPGFDWAAVRALPEVEALAEYADTDLWLEGVSADGSIGLPPGTADLMRTVERPVVLQGRLADPARADEAVVTPKFVSTYGKGVGDTVVAILPTPEARQSDDLSITGPPSSGPRIPMRIVGVVRSPWYSDGPQSGGSLLPSAALLRSYRPSLVSDSTWFNALVVLKGGEAALPAFKARLAELTGRSDLNVRNLPEELRHRQRAVSFEATWLLAFGVAAFVAALVLVGQALARYVGASMTEGRILRGAAATEGRSRVSVLLYSYHPVSRPIDVVLTAGRMPASAVEAVLAPESAAAIGVGVGNTITLTGTTGGPRTMTVSGIGFVPAGSQCTACSHASGGWVTDGGFDALFDEFQFRGGFVAVRPGARIDEVATRLQRAAATLGGRDQLFVPPYPPFAAAEIRQVQALPVALGTFLALLAVGALGHALATAVRRRRPDLAVLRALGMTRRQSRGVVVTQATLLALVGLVFGIPLGVALGRTVWRVVADFTPLQFVPPVSVWALLLAGPVTLLVANLLAAWPG